MNLLNRIVLAELCRKGFIGAYYSHMHNAILPLPESRYIYIVNEKVYSYAIAHDEEESVNMGLFAPILETATERCSIWQRAPPLDIKSIKDAICALS